MTASLTGGRFATLAATITGLAADLDRIDGSDPAAAAELTGWAATLTRAAAEFADDGGQREREIAARLRAMAARLNEAAGELRSE